MLACTDKSSLICLGLYIHSQNKTHHTAHLSQTSPESDMQTEKDFYTRLTLDYLVHYINAPEQHHLWKILVKYKFEAAIYSIKSILNIYRRT